MFYYKNKVKAVVMVVVVVLLLAVAVTVCLWDDTSIKSLKANGGTSNYKGVPWPSSIELGDRLTIDGIKYTVGYKSYYVTLYSDNISSKGVPLVYDGIGVHYNYDGTRSDILDPGGASSQIYYRINEYYHSTLSMQTITVDKTGVTYGRVSDYIIPHHDYYWYLWLPSLREVGLSDANAELQGSAQPVMSYYNSDARRTEGVNAHYWLRSTYRGSKNNAFLVRYDGALDYTNVSHSMGAARVALNLRLRW